MPRKSIDELGPLQREVMEIVWDRTEATVEEVRQRIRGRKKPAYTTILSVMQKLEKAGWLRHREEGRAYVYRPTRSRAEEGRRTLQNLVDRVFGSDPLLLFEHFLDGPGLDDEDLQTLRRMIDQRRKELRDESSR